MINNGRKDKKSDTEYPNAIEMEDFVISRKKAASSCRMVSEEMEIPKIQGFFHPFYENNELPLELAKKILHTVKWLREQWNYQEVYFTCFIQEDIANQIILAYQNGERITNAIVRYNHYQAKVMALVEKLLATEEYKLLRAFYIAPICFFEEKKQINEVIVRTQLEWIGQKLEEGHAVFCLVDQVNWCLKKSFSTNRNDHNETFSQALHHLTQKKLFDYLEKFHIPQIVKDSLAEQKKLRETILSSYELTCLNEEAKKWLYIKDLDEELKILDEKNEKHLYYRGLYKNELDFLISSLTDTRLLKTWPLNLNYPGLLLDQNILFKAVTIRQKQHLILNLISSRTLPNDLPDEQKQIILSIVYHEKHHFSTKEANKLAYKYISKLDAYLLKHREPTHEIDNDLASESNRIKLANILKISLRELTSLNESVSMHDFFSIMDSAESYARQLRGSHSGLQRILGDMIWESNFLKKNNDIEQENSYHHKETFLNEELLPDSQSRLERAFLNKTKKNILASRKWIAQFRSSDNADKIRLLKNYLINEIEKTYPPLMTQTFFSTFAHSKSISARRIKMISTSNLDQFWLILLAEMKGQESGFFSSDEMHTALKKALSILNNEVPAPSSCRMRHFILFHATQLLKYINQFERSWRYKFIYQFPLQHDAAHIFKQLQKLGELAHALLTASTPEALHHVVLRASSYKLKLLKIPLSQDAEDCNEMKRGDADSYLISIFDNLENEFKYKFKFHPIALQLPIELVWQEAFGNNEFMQEKFKDIRTEYQHNRIYDKNSANIDILMTGETREEIESYFDIIRAEWGKDGDVLLNENRIGRAFHHVITAYLNKYHYKSIKTINFNEMIDLFIKTDSLTTFPIIHNDHPGWTPHEKILMSNFAMKVKNVTVFTKVFAQKITKDDVIKSDERPHCDLYCINDSLFTNIIKENNGEMRNFNLKKFKSFMVKLILPCLTDACVNHPDGFILTTSTIIDYLEGEKYSKVIKNLFPIILQEIINENHTLSGILKGVLHTIDKNDGYDNITFLKYDIPYIQTTRKIGLCPQLNESMYQTLTSTLQTKLKKYFTVVIVFESSLSSNEMLYNEEMGISNCTNVWSKMTRHHGEFSNNMKQFLPVSSKELQTWDSIINAFNIRLMIGEVVTIYHRLKPEYILQKRCYDLLDLSERKGSARRASMCALADALLVSCFEANRELGESLREKIGSFYLESTRRRFPAIYQAEFCLATLNEVNTTRSILKEKLKRELTRFIKQKEHDLLNLYILLAKMCDEIRIEEERDNATPFSFFTQTSHLRIFLEEFSEKLKKNYPSISSHSMAFNSLRF